MTLPPQPSPPPPKQPLSPGPDPSMDDILASIRRILSEDDAQAPGAVQAAAQPLAQPITPPAPLPPAPPRAEPDDVLVLDASMMIPEPPLPAPPRPMPDIEPASEPRIEAAPPPPAPVPPPAPPTLVAPEAAAGVATSVGALMRTLASERSTAVHRGGRTVEDLVREELRPLLKEWLDQHLPPIVERAVRAEIERVVGRAVS